MSVVNRDALMQLKKYQERFETSPIRATFAYLKEAVARIVPRNPLLTHDTDTASVRSHASLMAALDFRAARLLQTAAARLAQGAKERGAWGAWNDCQSHLVQLAEAHIERVIFGCFLERIEGVSDLEVGT